MLPMNVDRICIAEDNIDWETGFLAWLEDKEKRKVGTADGVFVVTFDPSIRSLQPEGEQQYLDNMCVDSIAEQKFVHGLKDGLYQVHTDILHDAPTIKKYMEEATNPNAFYADTCCSILLKQADNTDMLFDHFETCISQMAGHYNYKPRSIVQLQETARKLRQQYDQLTRSTNDFMWEHGQLSDTDEEELEEPSCPHEICVAEYATPRREHDMLVKDWPRYGYCHRSLPSGPISITKKLSLSRIFNLLWLLPQIDRGFQTPYLYFGDQHTVFGAHVEDCLAWSLNFLHLGHPKIWVIVPPHATRLLEFHLRLCSSIGDAKCHNILGHKFFLPSVKWMQDRGIPFKIVIQRPGDLVVLMPSAAHFGFNSGPNIAEAVNIGTLSWLEWAVTSVPCDCYRNERSCHVHPDVIPLVAAFRKDLLPKVLKRETLATPQIIQGMEMVLEEMRRSEQQICDRRIPAVLINCPDDSCKEKFPVHSDLKVTRKIMQRHVKSWHKPVLVSFGLLEKIEAILDTVKET